MRFRDFDASAIGILNLSSSNVPRSNQACFLLLRWFLNHSSMSIFFRIWITQNPPYRGPTPSTLLETITHFPTHPNNDRDFKFWNLRNVQGTIVRRSARWSPFQCTFLSLTGPLFQARYQQSHYSLRCLRIDGIPNGVMPTAKNQMTGPLIVGMFSSMIPGVTSENKKAKSQIPMIIRPIM